MIFKCGKTLEKRTWDYYYGLLSYTLMVHRNKKMVRGMKNTLIYDWGETQTCNGFRVWYGQLVTN